MTVQPTRDQLRALADAATPAPWFYDRDVSDGQMVVFMDADGSGGPIVCSGFDLVQTDAEFIAAARTALPQLLDQLDQQEAELDSWMTRAYEAEKRAWRAEARVKAVRDALDEFQGDYTVPIPLIRRALEG